MIDSILKVVRGIVKLRGGTDNTIIGNTADGLRVQLVAKGFANNLPVDVLADDEGNLIFRPLTGTDSDFSFGDVATNTTTKQAVRRTAYIEQTSNAQRSIGSTSVLDTSAGTGARQVKITYLDSSGNGPYTETVTLNGLTFVNTVATNICYVENIEVVTVGTLGSNQGIITLKTGLLGVGTVIGTIAVNDNQTFWAHHYVPINQIANITGLSGGHNNANQGQGGVFTLAATPINVSNAVEIQISDFFKIAGSSSSSTRPYTSPLEVQGPAKIIAYVTPETSSGSTYRSAFDFFED